MKLLRILVSTIYTSSKRNFIPAMKRLFILLPFLLVCSVIAVGQSVTTIKDEWRLGLQDRSGKIISPCQWERIIPIPDSKYYVVMLGGKYGLLNNGGETIIPAKFSYIIPRLFGDKVLVNMGASLVSNATHTIELESKFIMNYKLNNQNDYSKACYYPVEKTPWMPRIDNYMVGGKWGIFNIKEHIPSISPSYDLLQVLPDEDRFIGLGYTYSGNVNYNIYDLQNDTFIFEFAAKKKKMISSMQLLSNGWAMINNDVVRYGETQEAVTVASNATDIIDASRLFVVVGTKRKGGVVYNKETGEVLLTGIQKYDSNIGGSSKMTYVQDSRGRYFVLTDEKYFELPTQDSEAAFMGDFIMSLTGGSPSVSIWDKDGRLITKTLINKFQEIDNGRTLYFIDSRGYLSMISSSDYRLQPICSGCTNFGIYTHTPDYALVAKESGWNNMWGIINIKTAQTVLPCKYPELSFITGDIYSIPNGSRMTMHSIKDTTFSLDYVGILYDEMTNDNLCWVREKESSLSMRLFSLDSLKFLSEDFYQPQVLSNDAAHPIIMNGDFFPVTNGIKWGMVDRKGNIAIDIKYTMISPFLSSEGFFIVTGIDGKFGYVNPYTKVELPCVFDDVSTFSNGVCPVMKLGKWGLADKDGNVLLSPQYRDIGDFFGDIFWLKKDNFSAKISFAERIDGSIDWIDDKGNILCNTLLATPSIKQVIPNGLWDF